MTPPTQAEIDAHMAVICPLCMEEITAGSPRAEVHLCGNWTVAHVECAEAKEESER